ncbi:hypothetical protein XM38_046420 [Halomicronema hongdechloris C2206]|uniref:Uncharacterized protein n=1 Tax=Halomicronema hongdechloris C2206 TaxID=1641165 RepID=A0A1Z3HTM7_9CYAN|nr:hypothetical protein XM38_046420 [Halomicronema hongdechloris C2206]
MPKLDCCDRCRFYSHTLYLVCANHPKGVETPTCPDFVPDSLRSEEESLAFYEPWQPEDASYYADELILDPIQRLTNAQRLELLDTHPLFTGRCPKCESPIPQTDPPRIHWD